MTSRRHFLRTASAAPFFGFRDSFRGRHRELMESIPSAARLVKMAILHGAGSPPK